jgi:uncharacterized RDD family membrane protein YckC
MEKGPETPEPGPETPGPPGQSPPPPGMPSVPPPGMPQAPPPGPQAPAPAPPPTAPGPPPTAPGPESPATGPQAPPAPPAYTGPVPPGGWQQPVQPAVVGGQLASWGSRLAAWFLDGLVLLIPGLILWVLIVGGAVGVTGDDDDIAWGALIGGTLLWILLLGIVSLLYAPLLMMRDGQNNGQTWGKQLLGIRVVRDNGQAFTFGPAALREVVLKQLAVGIASAIIPFIPWFLNYFWPLWDDENRALHDMAASTHVVKA